MRRIEKLLIGTVLGAVPIIAFTLAGWWISIPFVPESHVYRFALAGLLLGIICDGIFLKSWIRNAYSMGNAIWIGVYIFYSIGLFGMFMGVPVFNLILALPAGIFIGRRLSLKAADPSRVNRTARRAAFFTAGILGLICILSGSIALLSSSTSFDLQGMMGLAAPVSTPMIVLIIVAGGLILITLNYWLAIQSVKLSNQFFKDRYPG
jgi:hypothetical protein